MINPNLFQTTALNLLDSLVSPPRNLAEFSQQESGLFGNQGALTCLFTKV
jgi:hypothetical protein